ncbi:MAG: cytochrome C oxidase subunit IV family protein, partial [Gammaproteobacteria bacterium]|nr:cytochrome C oxidase subunit IV family protein [Gammaproteobacteria bacterium]
EHQPTAGVGGIWLFIITVVEVAVVFMPIGLWPLVVSLFVLMALKALGVLGYYMHLFSDAKTFFFLLVGGLLIAIAMLLSFGALFGV